MRNPAINNLSKYLVKKQEINLISDSTILGVDIKKAYDSARVENRLLEKGEITEKKLEQKRLM